MPAYVRRSGKRSPPLAAGTVRTLATRMLSGLGLERAELSVLLTDDATIRELNRQWRQQDKPTDVLAFPIDERAGRAAHERSSDALRDTRRGGGEDLILGDVVISLETAAHQARSRRRELSEEVRFLLAHGLLHLIGFDHADAEEKREMVAATRRLVKAAAAPTTSKPLPATPRRPRKSRSA